LNSLWEKENEEQKSSTLTAKDSSFEMNRLYLNCIAMLNGYQK